MLQSLPPTRTASTHQALPSGLRVRLDTDKRRLYNPGDDLTEGMVRRQSQYARSATLKEPPKRPTVTFEQLTYSNMLTLNALVELLAEKGVLSKPEILERVKKLQSETKVST